MPGASLVRGAIASPSVRSSAIARRVRRRTMQLDSRVLLLAAYLISAGYLISQVAGVHSYIWLVDELLYTKMAQGFAHGLSLQPQVFEHGVNVPNALFPLMLAPLYAVLNSTHAFTAAHIFDGAVFASTVFPVYLLGRRLGVSPILSVLAGLLSVWLPWAVAATVVMTESLAYALFAWAMLAIVAAVGDPRPRNDALAIVAIALVSYVRTQFLLMFAVAVLAIVLHEIGFGDSEAAAASEFGDRDRWWRTSARRHGPLLVASAAALLAELVLKGTGHDLLGNYAPLLNGHPFPPGLWNSAAVHLAHVFVGVGILPAVLWLAWIATTLGSPRTKLEHAAAVAIMLAAVAIVYEAAFIAQTAAGEQIQERYVLYLAPLLFVGAVHLIARPPRRSPRLAILLAGIAVAAVIGASGFSEREAGAAFAMVQNASATFNPAIDQQLAHLTAGVFGSAWPAVNSLALLAIVIAVLAGAVIARQRVTMAAVVLLAPLLAFTVGETTYVLPRAVAAINSAYPSIVIPQAARMPRNWIDAAVYRRNGAVGLLPGDLGETNEPLLWMWTEFWNKTIAVLYSMPRHSDGSGLPSTAMRLDRRTGRLFTGREERYLALAAGDPTLGVRGRLMHRSTYGAALIEAERPYRAGWAIASDLGAVVEPAHPLKMLIFPASTPSVETMTLTVEAPASAHRRVTVAASAGSERTRATLPPGVARRLSLRIELTPGRPPVALSLRLEGQVADTQAASAATMLPAPSANVIAAELARQ